MTGLLGLHGVPLLDPSAFELRVLLWPLLAGLGAYLVVTAPSQPLGRPKPNLRERLDRLDVDWRIQQHLEHRDRPAPLFRSPWLERLLRPVIDDLGRLLQGGLARAGLAWGPGGADVARKLRIARPGVDAKQLLGEKVVTGAIGVAVLPLMNVIPHAHPFGPWPGWLWLALGAVGYLAPDWQLERRLAERRTQALMELPAILDLLAIAAAAGLALEQATARVATGSQGVVADELRRATRDMTLGKTLSQALETLAQRNAVPELTSVMSQLRAAHEQGLPLAHALATQAEAIRERKRLRLMEIGGKATVKMLLPVALLILPVLFVVLLYPAGAELLGLAG